MRSALAIVGGLLLATRLFAAPLCGNSGPLDSSCGGGGGGGGSPGGGAGNIQINAGGGNFGPFAGISCTPGLCLDALDASGNPTCTSCGGGAINCTTASSLFCLAGRAGGQTAFGGTGASDTLNLGANSTIPAGVTVQLSGLGTNRVIIGPPVDPTAAFVPPGIVDLLVVDQGFAGANFGLWGVPGGTSLFGIQSGGTVGSPTATVDNSPIFSLTAIGTDATGAIFTIPEVAKFSVTAKLPSGTPQTGFVSGTVTLNSTDVTGTSQEHLFIDEQGRIGIQEGAPVGNPGDVSIKAKVFIGPPPSGPSNPGNANAGLELQAGTGNSFALMHFQLTDAAEAGFATPAGGMQFYNLDGGSGHDRFRGRLQSHWATFLLDDGAGNVTIPGNFSGAVISGTDGNFSGTVTTTNATVSGTFTAPGVVFGTRQITALSPLTGGGDFSADRFIGCQLANASQAGCLASVDWNTFNGKADSGAAFKLTGATPTCGTGCASVTGNDRVMTVTTGAVVSSVTVNFSTTLGSVPVCVASDDLATVSSAVTSVSTTSVTFGLSTVLTGHIFAHCFVTS